MMRDYVSKLLLALALLGLALAPPSAANASPAAAMHAMAGMSGDMPCCPDGRPMMPDCAKDCPLAVVCAPGLLGRPAVQAAAFVLRSQMSARFLLDREAVLSSIAREPPPRPPKA